MKQQSVPATHFVGKHNLYMQKGHPSRINILCLKKQQSVPTTHFVGKHNLYMQKGHPSRINILCLKKQQSVPTTESSKMLMQNRQNF